MHILDVISSVSSVITSYHTAGDYNASPDSLAGFKGPTFKDTTSKGRGWKKRERKVGKGQK